MLACGEVGRLGAGDHPDELVDFGVGEDAEEKKKRKILVSSRKKG